MLSELVPVPSDSGARARCAHPQSWRIVGQQARSCSSIVIGFQKLSLRRPMVGGRYKANELVPSTLDHKTRTAKAYDSEKNLDRIKHHQLLEQAKRHYKLERPWSSNIECRQSGSRITTGIDLITFSPLNRLVQFSHLSTPYLARFSKLERFVGNSAARDRITSSVYLHPYISQESFDRKHAHVLKRYMVQLPV